MATNTTSYGWTKPDYEDDADIAVLNETFDAIDAQVKTNENNILSLNGTSQTVDLDTLVYGGRYMVLNDASNPVANAPFTGWQTLDVYMSSDTSPVALVIQVCTSLGTGLPRKARRRTYTGSGNYSWGSWYT